MLTALAVSLMSGLVAPSPQVVELKAGSKLTYGMTLTDPGGDNGLGGTITLEVLKTNGGLNHDVRLTSVLQQLSSGRLEGQSRTDVEEYNTRLDLWPGFWPNGKKLPLMELAVLCLTQPKEGSTNLTTQEGISYDRSTTITTSGSTLTANSVWQIRTNNLRWNVEQTFDTSKNVMTKAVLKQTLAEGPIVYTLTLR